MSIVIRVQGTVPTGLVKSLKSVNIRDYSDRSILEIGLNTKLKRLVVTQTHAKYQVGYVRLFILMAY